MKRLTILLATAALGLVLALSASPANKNTVASRLVVYDQGEVFSAAVVEREP